ncbi:putative Ig domain-containing protein [Vibrio salinus]|uniref:putative Ig domain-containing protein n=1 Tax=Vibrio salinus TaxID=2899784 RepID=UPI001E401D2C|nr:putative Ig domain-containing protein [Vibrio salinus]MCE0495924.1 putative Ig domain-containing protein [Vibrio salinus]
MKGFTSDLLLHAFALEPRIVFDAAVTSTVDSVSGNSSDASNSGNETSTIETTTSDVAADSSVSGEATTITVTTEQNTIEGDSYTNYLADSNWSNTAKNIDDLVLSSDGKYAYSVTFTSGSYHNAYSSVVCVFSVSDDGSLSLVETVYNADRNGVINDGLSGASLITLSSDESVIYVYSETDSSIVTFTRDGDTGKIIYQQSQDVSTLIGSDSASDLKANNGYLYLTEGDSVYVLQSGNDSYLSVLATYTGSENTDVSNNGQMSFSEDGRMLFVGSTGDSSVMSVFAVSSEGTLSFSGTVEGTDTYFISSIVSTSDGSEVFAFQNGTDGTTRVLAMYRDSAGSYQIAGTYDVSDDVTSLMVSSDDSTLFTFGTSVNAYSIETDHRLGDSVTMNSESAQTSSHGVVSVAYSSGSEHIIAVSTSGLSVFSYEIPDVNYTEGNDAVVVLPDGVIGDSVLDALDNYYGASITIARTESDSSDLYIFIDGNSLTLNIDGNIELNESVIATWSSSSDGVTVSFTDTVSQSTAQQVLRQIAYKNTSDDPDANGSPVTLNITLKDGSGSQDTLDVTLNLTDVNDAPTMTYKAVIDDYTSGGDYISLFSETSIDTVEADQTIWKVMVTVSGSSDDDVLNVDGNIISLTTTSGTKKTVNGFDYQITETDDGVKTVILYVNSSVEDTVQLIDSIQYRNTSLDESGDRIFNLSVQELGVSENETSSLGSGSTIHVVADSGENALSMISGESTSAVTYTENSGEQAFLTGITISDSEMDSRNGGAGNYDGATLTVSIDTSDSGGELIFADSDEYTYSNGQISKDGVVIALVDVTNSEMKITFTEVYKQIPTTEDVNAVAALVHYTNHSDALPASSSLIVTLTDSYEQSSNSYVVTINNINVNDTPEMSLGDLYELGVLSRVTSTDDLTEIENVSSATLSDSGERLFIIGDDGKIAVYDVNSESGELTFLSLNAISVEASSATTILSDSDGSHLYIMANNSSSEITVYSVDEQGLIVQEQVVTLDYKLTSNFGAMSNMTLSDDGSYIFFTSSRSLFAVSIDSSTGELNEEGLLKFSSAWSEPYIYSPTAVTTSGNYVFVTTNFVSPTLIAYKITDSGIDWVGYIRDGDSDSDGNSVSVSSSIIDLEVSDDEQYVYAATDSSVTVYHFDLDSFTQISSLNIDNINDIAVSNDGTTIYVTTGSKELLRYTLTDGTTLTRLDSTQLDSADATISVTGQGEFFVGDHNYTLYQTNQPVLSVAFGESTLIATDMSLFDPDSDSYSGFTVTVERAGNTNTNDIFTIDSDSDYTVNDNGNVILNEEVIASISSENGILKLSVTGNLTEIQLEQLLQNIRYDSSSLAEGGEISFTLTVYDPSGEKVSQALTLDVVEAPVVNLDNVTLVDGKADTLYRQSLPDTIVSDPAERALSWEVSGLPQGLNFDSENLSISGIPTESAEYTINFVVTNSGGEKISFDLTLNIALSDADATPVNHITDSYISFYENQAINYVFSTDGVTDPQKLDLAWLVKGLPDGLNFNTDTLTLSGIVSESGSYELTFTVTNSLGLATTFRFSLSVNELPVEPNILQQRLNDTTDIIDLSTPKLASLSNNDFSSSNLDVSYSTTYVSGYLSGKTSDNAYTSFYQLNDWLSDLRQPDTVTTIQGQEMTDNSVSFDLFNALHGQDRQILQVSLTNGLSLPEGVQFNLERGNVTIDTGLLHRLGHISISVTVMDASGETKIINVDLKDQIHGSTTEATDTTNLEHQVREASSRALKAEAQMLLAELRAN